MSGMHSRQSASEVQRVLAILHKWGIHTLGQFAALNKEEISVRLGPEAVRMWERANGKSQRLLRLVQPPESFQESFEFENEIETAEPLLFILRRFLDQLSLRLGTIYLVAKELTLRITFTNRQQYERCFNIPQPTNDIDLLFRMLHTHLENFKSEHAITAVALEAQPSEPVKQQFGLFETTLRNPHRLAEALARLTALLGADRVGSPIVEETHKPDAFHIEPFSWHGLPAHVPSARMPMPRLALRKFRPPISSAVFLSRKIPAYVQSAKIDGKIIDQHGPFLLSGNWWDEKSWACAECDLQLKNGELIRTHESEEQLAIDGIYD